MTAWAAVAGSASVWLLVIVLATGTGYAMVLAWSRWGDRLPLPDPVGRAITVALGPSGSAAWARPPPPPPVQTESVAVPVASTDGPAVKEGPQRTVHPIGAADEAVQGTFVAETADADDGVDDDGRRLIRIDPADADGEDDEGKGAADAPTPAREPRPAHRLSRSDALTELSTVLGIEYDAAAALLDHGLWGFENFDEWSRSMRGRPRPDDVPEDAWDAATHRTWQDLEEEVEAHRVKHAAMQVLETLWGVGPEEAEALYAAGYKDVQAVRKASTDSIAKVPGIGQAKAFQIRAAAHGLAPTP